MTTIEASSFLDLAKFSINDFGAVVTLRKVDTENYDPTTGDLSTGATDYPTKGLIDHYGEYFIAQGLAAAGDRKVTLAASNLNVTPVQGDKIIIGTEVFDIVNVHTEFYADSPIIHTLHIRN